MYVCIQLTDPTQFNPTMWARLGISQPDKVKMG